MFNEEVIWYPLEADCELFVENLLLPENLDVERIWKEAVTKNPHLFNGKIFSLLSYNAKVVRGAFVEYKYFVASRQMPELKLNPLGVSGIIVHDGKVLIGKRASHLFSRPGLYELCPSGSLDAHAVHKGCVNFGCVNFHEQMDRELVEETSIPPAAVSAYKVLGLAHTTSDGIWDLVLECDLLPHFFEDRESHELDPTQEYSEFLWHDLKRPFLEAAVVPLTRFLLAHHSSFSPDSRLYSRG